MLIWIIFLLSLANVSAPPPTSHYHNRDPECFVDEDCGRGDVWIGVCEEGLCWGVINVVDAGNLRSPQPRRIL